MKIKKHLEEQWKNGEIWISLQGVSRKRVIEILSSFDKKLDLRGISNALYRDVVGIKSKDGKEGWIQMYDSELVYYNNPTIINIEEFIEQEDKQSDEILEDLRLTEEQLDEAFDKLIPKLDTGEGKPTSHDPTQFNVGESNYAEKTIQPWDIWEEYKLNPWDADIVKRILRTKVMPHQTPIEARILDYEKIIHIAQYRVSKLNGQKEENHEQ